MSEFEIDLLEILLRIAAAVESIAKNYKVSKKPNDDEKHQPTQILRERKEPDNPLTYGKNKDVVGTYMVHEGQDTRKIELIPIKPLKGDTSARMWLVNQIKQYDFEILENGGLAIEVPKIDKYGAILGKAAWCFKQELEEAKK